MKQIYDLVKVIDPHKHMPKKVKEAFFNLYEGELSNDSFVNWTVSPDEDKIVNAWLIKHGFKKGDEVLILYWW